MAGASPADLALATPSGRPCAQTAGKGVEGSRGKAGTCQTLKILELFKKNSAYSLYTQAPWQNEEQSELVLENPGFTL